MIVFLIDFWAKLSYVSPVKCDESNDSNSLAKSDVGSGSAAAA
jgi:hypothetical protein